MNEILTSIQGKTLLALEKKIQRQHCNYSPIRGKALTDRFILLKSCIDAPGLYRCSLSETDTRTDEKATFRSESIQFPCSWISARGYHSFQIVGLNVPGRSVYSRARCRQQLSEGPSKYFIATGASVLNAFRTDMGLWNGVRVHKGQCMCGGKHRLEAGLLRVPRFPLTVVVFDRWTGVKKFLTVGEGFKTGTRCKVSFLKGGGSELACKTF